MIVDFQHHFHPPVLKDPEEVERKFMGGKKLPRFMNHPLLWEAERHLAAMDSAAVDAAVLTCGLAFDGAPIELCRVINDGMKQVELDNPGRFVGLAHVPKLDIDAMRRELERCAVDLGMPGVVVTSEVEGLPIDSPELLPFWETCEELGLYVFVHPPGDSPVMRAFDMYDMSRSIAREFSLCSAVVRIINSGLLDRFPKLKVQFGHLGGGIAVLLERIRGFQDRKAWRTDGDPKQGLLPAENFDYYLRERLWFDTAGIFGSAKPVVAALAEIPPGRIVLGSDFPQEIRDGDLLAQFTSDLAELSDGNQILRRSAAALLLNGPRDANLVSQAYAKWLDGQPH